MSKSSAKDKEEKGSTSKIDSESKENDKSDLKKYIKD